VVWDCRRGGGGFAAEGFPSRVVGECVSKCGVCVGDAGAPEGVSE